MMVVYCWIFCTYLRFLFFFSSRRRHTRCLSDWSSDVCSSDLGAVGEQVLSRRSGFPAAASPASLIGHDLVLLPRPNPARSEERRVGKECRSRWSPYH